MTNEASLLQLYTKCSLHVFKRQLGPMHSYFLYISRQLTMIHPPSKTQKTWGFGKGFHLYLKFLCDVFLVWVDIYNSSVQETKQGRLATGNATGTTWCFRFRHSQTSTRLKLKFTCKRFSNAGTLGRFTEAWRTVNKQTTWSIWATIILIIL